MGKLLKLCTETAYLQISPYQIDDGELIGRDPREISQEDIIALGQPQVASAAIRAKCIECSGGNETEVRKCVLDNCALWPLRTGRNPYSTRKLTPEHLDKLAEGRAKAKAATAGGLSHFGKAQEPNRGILGTEVALPSPHD